MTKTSPKEPTMDTEKVAVEQIDRDAAADWCESQPFPSKQAEAPMIRAGEYDHHSLVQSFALHRLSAEARSAGRGGVGEDALREALEPFVNWLASFNPILSDSFQVSIANAGTRRVLLGDLRALVAALSPQPTATEETAP